MEPTNKNRHIIIECTLYDRIAQLIEKYKEKTGDYSQNKFFFYNNNLLLPELTVEQEKLIDGCTIRVDKIWDNDN